MISMAIKNYKIFLLLYVFSLTCLLLSKTNVAIPLKNLCTVPIYFGFQRFGVIDYGLIERRE